SVPPLRDSVPLPNADALPTKTLPALRYVPAELLADGARARLPVLPAVASAPAPVMLPVSVVTPVLVTVRVLVPSRLIVPDSVLLLLPARTAVVLGMLIALLRVSLLNRAAIPPPAKVTAPVPKAPLLPATSVPPMR